MNAMSIPMVRTLVPLLAALAAVLALAGCTDGRTATTRGELYHCESGNDCLVGWSCQCGYCQEPGAQQFTCGVTAGDTSDDASLTGDSQVGDDASTGDVAADSGATDSTSGTDATSDTGAPPVGTLIGVCNQTVSSDAVFKSCNLSDWTGCDAGYGCYYGPAIKQTLCKKHTALGEGATCDPCNLTECGLAADKHPLICDYVDKACRRTCDATVPVKAGQCPAGEQCYQLVDSNNVPYPTTGGICAK